MVGCEGEREQGRGDFEVCQGEATGEGEATVRIGDEGPRGQGDEGSSGLAGLDFEPMPRGGWGLAEFAFGGEVEVEEDEWEVAVAEQKVGAMKGLPGARAAEPDEVLAAGVAVGGGVEAILPVDQHEGEVALLVEEFAENEGGSGRRMGRDDFAELPGGKLEGSRHRFFGGSWNGSPVGRREFFPELLPKMFDLQDAQNMFIRTLFLRASRLRGLT